MKARSIPAARRNLLLERQCAQWRARPPAGSGDRRRLHRLDPGERRPDRAGRRAAAGHGRAARSRPRRRCRRLGGDRRRSESPAIRPCASAEASRGRRRVRSRPGRATASPRRRRRAPAIVSHALLPAEQTERWSKLAEPLARIELQTAGWAGVTRDRLRDRAGGSRRHRAAAARGGGASGAAARRLGDARPRPGAAGEGGAEALGDRDRRFRRRGRCVYTPPGAFFLLLAEAAAEDWSPVPLLALLKHPLAAAGRAPNEFRAAVRALERAVLRGPRPGAGLDGLQRTIDDDRKKARHDGERAALREAGAFVQALTDSPSGIRRARRTAFARTAGSKRMCAWRRRSAASDVEAGAARLWRDEAGEALGRFHRRAARCRARCTALEPDRLCRRCCAS